MPEDVFDGFFDPIATERAPQAQPSPKKDVFAGFFDTMPKLQARETAVQQGIEFGRKFGGGAAPNRKAIDEIVDKQFDLKTTREQYKQKFGEDFDEKEFRKAATDAAKADRIERYRKEAFEQGENLPMYVNERLPFIGIAATASKYLSVKDAAEAIEKDTATDEDYRRVAVFMAERELESKKEFGRVVVDKATAFPALAGEFLLTGGASVAARKAAAKAVAKYVGEGLISRVAGVAARSAAQTAMMPHVIPNAIQRMTPTVELNDQGVPTATGGENALPAISKAVASEMISNTFFGGEGSPLLPQAGRNMVTKVLKGTAKGVGLSEANKETQYRAGLMEQGSTPTRIAQGDQRALTDLAAEALGFGAFETAMHATQAAGAKYQDMRRRGYSEKKIEQELTGLIETIRQQPPDLKTKQPPPVSPDMPPVEPQRPTVPTVEQPSESASKPTIETPTIDIHAERTAVKAATEPGSFAAKLKRDGDAQKAASDLGAETPQNVPPPAGEIPVEKPAVGTPAEISAKSVPAPTEAAMPSAPRVTGSKTTIEAAGYDKGVPAEYAVFELDSLKPSHSYRDGGARPTAEYPEGLQPRDYSPQSEEDFKVRRFANEQKAGYYISTHPGAESGPPSVTPDGTVVNGNGRTMSLELSAHQGNLDWYRSKLAEQAQQFGIDPKQIEGMRKPVLVRVVDMDAKSPDAAKFASAGNVSTTQSQSPARTAGSLGRLIDESLIDSLKLGEDTTFSEAVVDPAGGKAFRERLRAELPPSEIDRYFQPDGRLTEAGTELSRSMLLSKILPTELIERLGEEHKGLKRSVEGAIPQMLKLRRDYAESDPTTQLVKALNVRARNPNIRSLADVDNMLSQGSLFGGNAENISPAGRMMLDFVLQNADKPTVFRKKLANLITGTAEKSGLFGEFIEDDPTTIASRALGVEHRPGAFFGSTNQAQHETIVEGALTDAITKQRKGGRSESAARTNVEATRDRFVQAGASETDAGVGADKAGRNPTADASAAASERGTADGQPEQPAEQRATGDQPERISDVEEPQGYGTHAGTKMPVRMDAGHSEKPLSSHEIIRTLSHDFDVPINIAKIRHKHLAHYLPKSQVVRSQSDAIGDLGVMSHEVSHHIDKTTNVMKRAPKSVIDEVRQLDYEPQKARPHEGFAEFMRHYFTTDDAKTLAPNFHSYFEGWLKNNPGYQAKVAKARTLIEQWREQGAMARVQGNISQTGKDVSAHVSAWESLKEKTVSAVDRGYTMAVDEMNTLEQFTIEAKKAGAKFKPGESPIELARFGSQLGPTDAARALEDGPHSAVDYRKKLGPSLRDALSTVKGGELPEFEAFLYANHAVEAHAKGINPGISIEDAKYVQQMYSKPEWVKAARKFTEYMNGTMKMAAEPEVGVISQQSANAMEKDWQSYVPLLRVRPGTVEGKRAAAAKQLVDLPQAFKRRVGGDFQIISPIQVAIERTAHIYTRARQQMVMNKIYETSRTTPGLGHWAVEEPAGLKPTRVTTEEATEGLRDSLQQFGLTPEDVAAMQPDDAFNIFRPDYFYKGDQPVVRIIDKGNPKLIRLDPDLFRFSKGMDQYRLPWFLDATAGALTRVRRLGATGLNPDFAITNFFNDALSYLVQTDSNALTAIPRIVRAAGEFAFSEIRESLGGKPLQNVKLYRDSGGELSHRIGQDRNSLAIKARDMTENDAARKAYNIFVPPNYEQASMPVKLGRALAVESPVAIAKGLGKTVAFISHAIEMGPRLAEFDFVMKRGGYDRGRIRAGQEPPQNLVVEAINAAKDVTVNFGKAGSVGKVYNQLSPFVNARIQALDKFVRTWKDHPTRTAMRVAALIVAPTIAYWWNRKDDDDYKESPTWLKYGFWEFTDDEGKPVARIPRTHEWGWTVSASTQAALDLFYEKNPQAFKDYAKHISGSINPFGLPTGLDTAAETFFNYDLFKKRAIVPASKEKLEPRDQATDYNAPLMKAIGERLNVSPAKLEHLVQSVTGGGYRRIENLTQLAGGKALESPDLPFVGGLTLRKDYSRSSDEFYQKAKQVEQSRGSQRLRGKVEPSVEAEHHRLGLYAGLVGKIRDEQQAGEKEGKLQPSRDDRFETEKYEIGLYRAALGREELQRYPNPLKVKRESLPETVRKPVEALLVRSALHVSAPSPERHARETFEAFTKRRDQHRLEVEQARAILAEADIEQPDLWKLVVASEKKAGRNVASNGMAERHGRLIRQLSAKKQPQ